MPHGTGCGIAETPDASVKGPPAPDWMPEKYDLLTRQLHEGIGPIEGRIGDKGR